MRSLTSILTLAVLFIAAGDARAQEAGEPDLEHELRTMVAEPAAADRDRQQVRDFLERAGVQAVAAERGLDLESARVAVGTMDGTEVADLARHIRDMDEESDLVGGNTIVISASTVIIILLILLLVSD